MAKITYREAVRKAMEEEMLRDDSVYIQGEEVGVWGGSYAVTRGMLDQFGEKRVKDTPIAETGIVGTAVGAAMYGLRPIAELMTTNFSLVAIDQIVNNAAKVRSMFGGHVSCPVVIRMASGWGQLAATHSQTFESYFAYVPGLKVVMPGTPYDAKGLLKSAIRDDDPVVFIEHSRLYGVKGEVPEEEYLLPIGVSDVKREGTDVTLITYSRMVYVCLEAAEQLAAEDGIDAEVVDLRTLRPMDLGPVLKSIRKTYRAVVVSEDWPTCGITSEVAARVQEEAFDSLDAPVHRVTMKDVPMPYAKNLEEKVVPGVQDVVRAVKRVAYVNGRF